MYVCVYIHIITMIVVILVTIVIIVMKDTRTPTDEVHV